MQNDLAPVRYVSQGGFVPQFKLLAEDTGEDIYDVHNDHLDTPRMLTDKFGVPSWRANYAAFGKAHLSSDPDGSVPTPNPDLDFNIRFPGQYFDAESGLHYNRHRYYAPDVGRYISADPIGQMADENLYRYAKASPLTMVDPWGLEGVGFWTFPDGKPPAPGDPYTNCVRDCVFKAFVNAGIPFPFDLGIAVAQQIVGSGNVTAADAGDALASSASAVSAPSASELQDLDRAKDLLSRKGAPSRAPSTNARFARKAADIQTRKTWSKALGTVGDVIDWAMVYPDIQNCIAAECDCPAQ